MYSAALRNVGHHIYNSDQLKSLSFFKYKASRKSSNDQVFSTYFPFNTESTNTVYIHLNSLNRSAIVFKTPCVSLFTQPTINKPIINSTCLQPFPSILLQPFTTSIVNSGMTQCSPCSRKSARLIILLQCNIK